MKKIILSSLFSATLLMGGTSAFADTVVPGEPMTPPREEVTPPSTEDSTTPSDPVLPPETGDSGQGGGDTGTTIPPETGDSGQGGGDTGTSTPPETGDSGQGGGDTGTPTPPETGDSGQGGGDTGTSTPPETGDSGQGSGDTGTPTPPSQNVVVKPDGTIGGVTNSGAGTNSNGTQNVPIISNDINELTHIPTPSTPIETETGEKIVSVVDGVAYKQKNDGTLAPISGEVKQLASGNIAVKGSDGQLKVLPKTGTKQTVMMTVLGSLLMLGSGFAWWKKRA